MKWSILIVTLPERAHLLSRLLSVLCPQVAKHKDIQIIIRQNPGYPIGDMRRVMMEMASGEYLNFIDDDDMIPENYVEKIYPLLDGVDYVGFEVSVYRNGVFEPTLRASHSLQHRTWSSDDKGNYRDISHLNPIRRELATSFLMEGDRGEDGRWASGLRNLGIVRTEHNIPETMYFYMMDNG